MSINQSCNMTQTTENFLGYDDSGIFVVGCPRSGTTLLRMILDSHPLLCSGEETGFLEEMENIVTHRWHQLKHFGLQREEVLTNIRKFFLTFHHNYCLMMEKNIWIDKSPDYVKNLGFINELFPKCKVIHIIRDGRDVAASYREKWGRRGFFKALCDWVECVRKGRSASIWLGKDRYFELRYEDLVNNPRMVLNDLIKFLGFNWDESLMNHTSQMHVTSNRFGFERPLQSISKSKTGTWRKRLCWHERLVVKIGFYRLLVQLGYIKNSGTSSVFWLTSEKLIFRIANTINLAFDFFDKMSRHKQRVSESI